jgi:hypothetical protein
MQLLNHKVKLVIPTIKEYKIFFPRCARRFGPSGALRTVAVRRFELVFFSRSSSLFSKAQQSEQKKKFIGDSKTRVFFEYIDMDMQLDLAVLLVQATSEFVCTTNHDG